MRRPSPSPNRRAPTRPAPAVAAKGPGRGAGAGARGQGQAAGGSGSAKGAGQGAGSQGVANYQGTLAAWLNRHKRYPDRARRLRQQGTVRVSFTIDRQGRLISHRIVGASGYPLLDQEVEALVRRASPMPPFPAGLTQSQLTITVPISFNLR
ncbi:MAG: energy transducer TonB [Chromatiales bacterium]|nr:energy transducer TonB [Chromatiales bacterium]